MGQIDQRFRVPPEKLRWGCDPATLPFECTESLQPLQSFIGQDRALRALQFGLEVGKPGYNLFVTGLTGTGKTSAIQHYVRRLIAERGTAVHLNDWCYCYNFQEADRPQAIRFPAGQGPIFRARIEGLLREVREEISEAFSSDDYVSRRDTILKESQAQQQRLTEALQQEVNQEGFLLQFSLVGVALLPIAEGRPISGEQYAALPPEQRQSIEEKRASLLEQVEKMVAQVRELAHQARDKMKELNRTVGEFSLTRVFQNEREEFKEIPEALQFLDGLQRYTLDHLSLFREGQQPQQESDTRPAQAPLPVPQPDPFLPFKVNVFVDNADAREPPITVESNPTWSNLFGRIERRAHMGTYFSDHTMLKAGSVHQANGGYLVVNAQDVLTSPGVWDGLKRVIRTREVRLEDPAQQFGFIMPQGLRPQPVPVELKVIVVGDERLYRLLSTYDREDFWEMFKVKAEFDYQIDLTKENLEAYAAFICGICETEELRHFDRSGVARVLEQGARMVSDQTKLSSRFGQLKDLLIEADYWARKDGSPRVKGEHVRKAVEEKVYRLNLVEERIRQLIAEGTIMVDVEGEVVGQVNGLAVYDLGDFSFGRPSRITAKTFAGRRGVINIERESQLSGRIHDKGVLILSGYLGYKYAQDRPLSLSASLCFEQSYEGVEGDSASSTELYAILSSLSGLAIKQGIAVTGSVNQKGEIQPIGGVNQKVEGFFDICRVKGLTGEQGVLIPRQNVKNLMLRDDVVQATKEGKFRLWSVGTIDEGIEILTGVPAGERQPDGGYPEGTVNFVVRKRLEELSESLRGFYAAILEEAG